VVVVDDVVGCVVVFLLLIEAGMLLLEEVGLFLGNVNTRDILG